MIEKNPQLLNKILDISAHSSDPLTDDEVIETAKFFRCDPDDAMAWHTQRKEEILEGSDQPKIKKNKDGIKKDEPIGVFNHTEYARFPWNE